ncbi:phosphotransferase [Paenibacillus sp. SC116]|uniref:phosphotransferase enzyme family protein n=1 Tax=Paenibacillus sp. SC116 TaxID=2968986 RepID=UPI00215A4A13|nr:phosphotransferase [Paenibacillus sp. SC116]MCR8846420.1 phosphotransferase [Paenibacillus sp. SC116]
MNLGWNIDTDEKRRALLAQVRNVTLSALQQYTLEWSQIKLNKISDTITFKINTELDETFLLRIHNNSRSKAEIQSEMMLLQVLGNHGLTVPQGQASRTDEYVLEMVSEEGETLYITLMSWLEGELLSDAPSETQAMNTGILMARLHRAAASFVPDANHTFPTWGADSFRKSMAKLEQYYDRFLSDKAWGMYQAAADKIIADLEAMEKNESARNFGLIHADLHFENVIFRGEEAFPIDFARSGYGYYLYDIAGTILGLGGKHRQLFLKGYESVRKLDEGYMRPLASMFVMFMIENYCHHSSDPRETAGLIAEQPYAQAIIQSYLQDRPFLFEPLEPITVE